MNTDSIYANSHAINPTVQSHQANPYGNSEQMKRSAIKAPIPEKLNNSIEAIASWTWRITCLSAVFAVLGSLWISSSPGPVTGPDASGSTIALFVVNIIASTLVGIGLICGAIFAFVVRKQAKQIEAMQAGHYLARWDLDRDQWKEYIAQEKEKAGESIATSVFVCVFIGLLMWYPMSGLLSVMTCLSGILGLGLFGLVMGWTISAVRTNKLENMLDSPRFTVIGHDGLYFQNAYHVYSAFGSGLSHIEPVQTGSMHYLVFTFFNQTNNGRTEYERRVPVPRGREEEAAWIIKQIS